MDQNRKRNQDVPNRSSNMEKAEGSRENIRNSRGDLGSSSDRAMFDESAREGQGSSDSARPTGGSDSTRGKGSSSERNSSSSSSSGSTSSGISNRSLDREQCEQEQLPERGRSQSER